MVSPDRVLLRAGGYCVGYAKRLGRSQVVRKRGLLLRTPTEHRALCWFTWIALTSLAWWNSPHHVVDVLPAARVGRISASSAGGWSAHDVFSRGLVWFWFP